jgi:hypothetical protein
VEIENLYGKNAQIIQHAQNFLARHNGALPKGEGEDGRERRLRVDGVASSLEEKFLRWHECDPKGAGLPCATIGKFLDSD